MRKRNGELRGITDDQLNERLGKLEERIFERIERVETNFLSAFRDWSQPVGIRLANLRHDANAVEERLTLIEERLQRLERRHGESDAINKQRH